MNSRVAVTACISLILTACGNLPGGTGKGIPPCACPAPPPNMIVAQRGANEIAIYPRTSSLDSPPPISTIPAPGAESLTVVTDMESTETFGFPVLYVGEYPSTVAVVATPYSKVSGTISAGINDPAALAASMVNGSEALFVANRGANDVTIYEGTHLNFVTPAVTIGGLDAPDGLAFDAKGNLWVAQASNVVEFAPPFTSSSSPVVTISSGLKSPSGIAFDTNGLMYVADKGNNSIVVYPAGSFTPSVTVTRSISGPGSLLNPDEGLVLDTLFVPNVRGNNITEFSLPLTSTSEPLVIGASGMNEPSAVAFLDVTN
ncbi:MAG TPA: hypothetical protein VKT72_14605 [Candidatus Baltobacteraceae bacterium]|nr:hypothetical protein [Candidatus Baltobacteraceae bacterium]